MNFKVGDKVWYRKRIGFRFSRVVSGTIDKMQSGRATIVGTTKKGVSFSYTTSLDKLNLKKEIKMNIKQLDRLIENIVRSILLKESANISNIIKYLRNYSTKTMGIDEVVELISKELDIKYNENKKYKLEQYIKNNISNIKKNPKEVANSILQNDYVLENKSSLKLGKIMEDNNILKYIGKQLVSDPDLIVKTAAVNGKLGLSLSNKRNDLILLSKDSIPKLIKAMNAVLAIKNESVIKHPINEMKSISINKINFGVGLQTKQNDIYIYFIPKTSNDIDLINLIGEDKVIKDLQNIFAKKLNIILRYNANMPGAGMNFLIDKDKLEDYIINKLK